MIDREIGRARVRCKGCAVLRKLTPKRVVDLDHLSVGKLPRQTATIAVSQHQRGFAVIDAQRQAFRAEQGEQRHANRATLYRAKQAGVKTQRGFENYRDTITFGHPSRHQPVGEAPGEIGELGELNMLGMAVGKLDAHRRAARAMAIQAFMRQVHRLGIAVEQLPKPIPREIRCGFNSGIKFGDLAHEWCRAACGCRALAMGVWRTGGYLLLLPVFRCIGTAPEATRLSISLWLYPAAVSTA